MAMYTESAHAVMAFAIRVRRRFPCAVLERSNNQNPKVASKSPHRTSMRMVKPGGSIPICRANTLVSHTTLAKSGNAMTCLNATIHSPGLGKKRRSEGLYDRSKYGAPIPSPKLVKTSILEASGREIVAARAEPINGAVHGVATAVARAPLKNEPI
jgi:hypothetical protein